MNNYWQLAQPSIPHLIVTENDGSFKSGFIFYRVEPVQGYSTLNNFYFSESPSQNANIIRSKSHENNGEVAQIAKLEPRNQTSESGSGKVVDNIVISQKKSRAPKSKTQNRQSEIQSQKSDEQARKGGWTSQEERKLKELVELFGQQWKQICEYFPDRNPKQIRQRYLNYLRPNLSCEKWSPQEDAKILQYIGTYGRCWKMMEKKMKNRSQNQIKNRYYGHLKKIHEKNVLPE